MLNKLILSISAILMVIALSGCGTPEPSEPSDQDTARQIPADQSAEVVPIENRCFEACENYVKQCLHLMPNADEYVFDQGRESCMQECAGWEFEKVECMAEAMTCVSMTDMCKL